MAGWHFVTIPKEISENIEKEFDYLKKGWGSLPVAVTIGKTTWKTSIFPDKKTGGYVLPIKADIRKRENISANDKISLLIEMKK
jgi:hypothetical protein